MYTVTHKMAKTDVLDILPMIHIWKHRGVLLGFVVVDCYDVIWCEKFADAQYIAEYIKSTGVKAKVNNAD